MTKDKIEKEVADIITNHLLAIGLDIVEVFYASYGSRGILRIFIDRIDEPGKVNIGDCVSAEKIISSLLDESNIIEGRYSLEVSSPGLTRALKSEKDYIRFKGRTVKIQTRENINGKNLWIGKLCGMEGATVILEVQTGSKKNIVKDTICIPITIIAKANLEIE